VRRPTRSILFCIYSHNAWGGIETWLREMLRAFEKGGWDVSLALAAGKRHNDVESFRRAFGTRETETIDGRTGTHEGRIAAALGVLGRRKPAVVVPLGLAHVARAVGRMKASGDGPRLVLPVHALSLQAIAEALDIERFTDVCIGVNGLLERVLRSEGYKGSVRTIENGAPQRMARASGARERGGPLHVAFVGRFEQETKRVLDVVELAAELRRRGMPYRVTMTGDGPARELVEARIRDTGVGEHVEVLGYVPRDRLLTDLLPTADVLVLPSATEASPLVPLEAMSRGVVPLVASFAGLEDLSWFRDGETARRFPTGGISIAADIVEELDADRERLAEMSKLGLAEATNRSWESCGRTWVRATEEMLERPAADAEDGREWAMRRAGGSRLEALGLPPRAADLVRRALRWYPDFEDGWAEWPGTLGVLDPELEERLRTALRRSTG